MAPAAPGAGAPGPAIGPSPAQPELRVYEVPPGRLVASTLLHSQTIVLALLVVAVVVAVIAADSSAPALSLFPIVLGIGSAVFGRFNRAFAFRAGASADGIRLRHGLTETRAQTIPVHRVQAVELHQPWLWRGFDWWRVQVNVAGYGRANDRQTPTTVLLPVGTRDEAVTALWLVLPDLGVPDPRGVLEEGLTGLDASSVYTAAPRRSRWLDPLGWRRNGFTVLPRAVLARSGRLRRTLVVVPHGRTQSLGLEQGPWQRRLGLATFVLHSTPGAISPAVPHLDAHVARGLLDEQAWRAREARARDDARDAGGAA
jgi:putative membrane protein